MKNILSLFLLFISLNTFSQKEANFWYFGNGAALDFNSGSPVPVNGSQLNTLEGCSSFSDANGNLLFYVGAPTSDGRNLTIWNKNNTPMPNGTGLEGDSSSSQSALTIPAPGKPNIYYLFTVGAQSSENAGFWYYTIDMSLNGGLGDVVAGPVVLGNLSDHPNWSEKVTAVKAKDCSTFWVISAHGNNFYAYKVDNNGVNSGDPKVSTIIGYNATSDPRGYLKVSPDGTKLASGNMSNRAYLFNFNDETGEVTNFNNTSFANQLNIFEEVYGVEFSASSRRLYLSTGSFTESIESLYQFDLTKPTLAEINASRYLVHQYVNTRGALQLGPDGKIYWTSNNSNFISVVNKPDELGIACDYSHQTVRVGNGAITAGQGLPPFLSSLLLPIEIKDVDKDIVINNQDLEFCIGENKTLAPETISGNNRTYEWTFDNGTNTSVVSSDQNLVLTNISPANAGKYTLVLELTDDCGNITKYEATFNIGVFEAAVATKPNDILFCDTDNDGFNTFDLTTENKNTILGSLDPAIFDVLYFDNLADANSGDNPLPDSFTNPTAFSSQIVYARVQNTKAPNACFNITTFKLAVTGFPEPIQPTPYRICDDNASAGGDTDEVINNFVLSSKDSEILGTLNNTQYTITYHTTQLGAETNDASTIINKNTNHSVTNSQTVYIRVENINNAACFDTSKTLELIVDPLPVVSSNPIFDHCVSANNTNPTINLTSAQLSISNTPNVRFQFFSDALGASEITNITSYPVQPNATQSVFVKVFTSQNCTRDIVELTINVGQTPDNPYNVLQPAECDDFLDANGVDTPGMNSDTDGITHFSLDENAVISVINPPPNTEVTFYENITDRANSLNEIDITNYRNNLNKIEITNVPGGIQFPIYYKILSTINNNCQGLGQFNLQVNSTPTANPVTDLELCDDVTDGDAENGIKQNFDLEAQTASILGSQNPADFSVTYHLSAAEANSGSNPQTSPFANTVRDIQPIFVRVTNNNTGCFTDHTSFNLIVNPIPVANFVADLEICDDNSDGSARNGFSQTIDLTSQTAGILGTQDPANHTVSYHRNLTDAQNGNNTLSSPYSNLTPNRETIFVRVVNTTTSCVNGISNFDVIVNPEPTFTPVSNLSYCDDDLDGDDTNGIIQNIDLDSQIPALLGSQDPDDFNVTFHANDIDAATGFAPIASPYTNSNPTETIFVRIQNKRTLCINDDARFQLIVNPLPDFRVTSPQIFCLNDTSLTIGVENPAEVYNYEWKDSTGTIISFAETADVTVGGNYTVTATTTNGTNCTRSETIVVNESNPANLLPSFVTIVDEGNIISSDANLSISIDIINNDLGPGDYQFALKNDDKNTTTPFQNEPLFENLEGGIYTIIVNDKNGCVPDATLQVSVIQFPKFFTPNGDGKNDTWAVKGANKTFYPNASINIFNRYGKLVAQIPVDSQGWNGTYNGKLLTSDDYWYNITLIPADKTKPTINKKGNFSLVRR